VVWNVYVMEYLISFEYNGILMSTFGARPVTRRRLYLMSTRYETYIRWKIVVLN
jgi:hypothetical protein